jgi:hypothetical protein
MRPSRAGNAVARTLNKTEMEERLDGILRRGGEKALNDLRDEARTISRQLDMGDEFKKLDEMIGSFLGTRESSLESSLGQARKRGLPYDPERLDLFADLFEELRKTAPATRLSNRMTDAGQINLAFFEAYFSNYIEGTEFHVEEAVDIVFNAVIPEDRPEDAHDVLGTYRVVSDLAEMRRQPRNFEAFIDLIKSRHAAFMELRPDKKPGHFKAKENHAGSTFFVAPDLVVGTLEKGYEIYRAIEPPLHRAIFVMFLVSEVHPFVDGNGRAARIMMNAELVAGGEQKIIVPTIYRNNYLSALKALSHTGNSTPFIRTLDFAQKYTTAIPWDDFDAAQAALQNTNAFTDANEAEDIGIRLVLPHSI